MPVRCLNYITNLYLDMIKEKGESISLPPIFPLVLYNGDEKWNHSNKVSDFIKNNNILGNYGINFEIFLLKENTYSLQELLEIGNIVSTLFITESYYNSELVYQEVQKILDKYGITIPLKLFLNYFRQMSKNEKVDIINNSELEKLYKTKEEVNSMLLTAVRKEKDDLRKEGEVIGIKKEKTVITKNLLKMGLSVAQIAEATGLSVEEIEKLKKQL